MYLLLIILIVLAAILLCFVVMIQNSKGGGLASNFASSNQIMGVRKTTDFLEKGTWGLAGCIVLLSILTAYTVPSSTEAEKSVILKENMMQAPGANPLNAPKGFATPSTTGTEQQQAPAQSTQDTPAEQPAQAAE